jgi:hypothetical protein
MMTKKGRIKKNISTVFESDIKSGAVNSSSLKIEAIRLGLEKAMDEFLAYISAKSAQ